MRITLLQTVLIGLTLTLVHAHEAHTQGLLDRAVSVKFKNTELRKVLSQIEEEVDVKFVYSSTVIQPDRRVSVRAEKRKLSEVLAQVLEPLDISYRVIGGQIMLTRLEAEASSFMPGVKVEAVAEQIVSGTVTDEGGGALPGVSILVKGTQRGTTTNVEGSYSVVVPDNNAVLVFSYVGYQSQEVAVENRTRLDVSLKIDNKSLDEVVVVGYGTQKRADITGSLASVNAQDIKDIPSPSLDATMTGRMPGVYAAQTTGTPGGGLTVRVRGSGSIGAGNEPLYVIDGFPVTANYNQTSNPLNSINPNDIESIEVLKDASATAIYGSRGSNGVVIVTTKAGKSGKMTVDIDSYVGVQNVVKTIDLMNASEFAQYIKDSRNNAYVDTGGDINTPSDKRGTIYKILPDLQNPESLGEGTNWQKEIYRPAAMRNLQLRIAGGNDRVRFMVSGGYFKQEGVIINSDFERYSFRVNLDA